VKIIQQSNIYLSVDAKRCGTTLHWDFNPPTEDLCISSTALRYS